MSVKVYSLYMLYCYIFETWLVIRRGTIFALSCKSLLSHETALLDQKVITSTFTGSIKSYINIHRKNEIFIAVDTGIYPCLF